MGPGYLILEDLEIPTKELQKLAYEERTTTLQREKTFLDFSLRVFI